MFPPYLLSIIISAVEKGFSMKNDIQNTITNHAIFFNSGATKNVNFRLNALKKLQRAIYENIDTISEALWKDLRKSQFEAYETEIGIVLEEIRLHIKLLKKWSTNKRVSTPIAHFPSKSFISPEPLGTVLIIAPWNYPFQLILSPLIGAISAGNCVVLKPADYSENTSNIIAKIIRSIFEPDYISVFLGGREVNTELLAQTYEYIFFTGSSSLGKIVMLAAARNLTPLTLELGGKSPCVVAADADLRIAATRIIWGKFLNSGQTCIAPDYLLVHSSVKEKLLMHMKEALLRFFGEDAQKSVDYPRIINKKQHARLVKLLKDGNVLVGGNFDEDDLYVEPTILDNVAPDSQLMTDEIFGPLLPIIEWTNADEMISFIKKRPKPLAFYLFTSSNNFRDLVFSHISFGGSCVNDTIVHVANPALPFGGVGLSGMGKYHGKASFDLFSNKRSVLQKSTLIDLPIRYAPYKGKLKILSFFLK